MLVSSVCRAEFAALALLACNFYLGRRLFTIRRNVVGCLWGAVPCYIGTSISISILLVRLLINVFQKTLYHIHSLYAEEDESNKVRAVTHL